MSDISEPDEREWVATGEQAGAARAGETMWQGPFLKPEERVVMVPKSRLESAMAAAAERFHVQAARAERERERAEEAEASLAARTGERDGLEVRCADREARVQSLTEILAELVRLKDLKDTAKSIVTRPYITWTPEEKNAAWQKARAALPVPVGGEADR